MKKLLAILFGLIILATVTSCQDELEEKYTSPDQTSEASIAKFFTKMLNNDRVRPSYWNVRTFLVMHPARYVQTVSYSNSNQRYQQQLSYIDDYWRDYYTTTGSGVMAHYREIQKAYNQMSDEEKANAEVFIQATNVIVAEQTAKLVDLWGDVPFYDAGGLMLDGDGTPPEFDDAAELYSTFLQLLEEAGEYFASADLGANVAASFRKQDILLEGDLDNWSRFANSLRLRLLMRISFANESTAEAEIMEMLNNPDEYPLVDEASFNVLLEPLTNYTDNMNSALTEVTSHLAPKFLLDDILKPANDPRIRVWYDKNTNSDGEQNTDYFSMPLDIPASEQELNINRGNYAVLDTATFLQNNAFPGILITSSEVNFLKAEAYERWGSTTEAEEAYVQGVTDAVNFMFYLNSLGNGKEDALETAEIDNMLATPSVEYTGTEDEKLAKIWTQKWLSFGFMQSIQSWAEVRRTKVPELTFVEDTGTPGAALPPSRLLYPNSEKTYNATNYAKVAADDLATGKIFWDVK